MQAVVDLGVTLPARRALTVDRAVAWRVALGALVALSFVARTGVAWLRATPNYFPDEYIYTSLSRSIAAGHLPSVRGQFIHFPALLEPLLTAPAWWFGSLETGYRITQAIDSAAMSTAALAVWWTARRLGVSRGPAFAAAAIAIAVPDLGYSGWVLSEPFAYPLFVATIGAGALALARPTRRTQSVFVALALLAMFARVQLAVLFVAYLAAAVVLRRVRAQRVVAGSIGALTVLGAVGGLGYYHSAPSGFHLSSPTLLGRNLLVLAFAAGWVIVPAGLLGLVGAWRRPRSEEERAFGAFALTAAIGVLIEATLYGGGGVVRERYGCYVLPLVALGFALHASRGWPWRRAHAGLALALLLVSATVPMAAWAVSGGNAHSLFLTGLLKLESLAGTPGEGSLWLAAVAGVLSVATLACAWRRATTVAAALAIAFCIAASAFATSFDVQNSRNVRAVYLPAGPQWVSGSATLVASASSTSTLEQLFWNRGVDRVVLMPGVPPPDPFAKTASHVTSAGRLAGVHGQVVLDEDGIAYVPAAPERTNGPWLSARTAQLVAELGNRSADGWLSPAGKGRVFGPGSVSFAVTAPQAMTMTLAGKSVHLRANVATRVCASGDFTYSFSQHGYLGYRPVSAKSSFPQYSARGC
ncbi:MAG TPA: hypothetical protein VHV52_05420 [Gaiellaceae bacterium]|nr:hypothetical protein [Gaiellaceae bacterium]